MQSENTDTLVDEKKNQTIPNEISNSTVIIKNDQDHSDPLNS